MVDIFIIRANAWGFFVLTQTFSLLGAVVCGSVFPRQSAAQAQEASSVSVSTSIQVTAEALAAQPVGANWLSYNGDYTGRRFSSLEQINAKNVEQLPAQWVFHAPNSNSLEAPPAAFDRLIFIPSPTDSYAL